MEELVLAGSGEETKKTLAVTKKWSAVQLHGEENKQNKGKTNCIVKSMNFIKKHGGESVDPDPRKSYFTKSNPRMNTKWRTAGQSQDGRDRPWSKQVR
jgi:hypothetical protein